MSNQKEKLAMYILVNEDIKIGKGKLAGQVGHAVAVYFYKHLNNEVFKEAIDEYMNTEQQKIILKCPQSVLEDLEKEGCIAIRDKGHTQLEPNTLTCVNMGLMRKDHSIKWMHELKLY